MPVPNAMSDLSQLPGSNYPVGSEAIGNNLDNYLRAHAAMIRQSNAVASSTMPAGSTVNVSISDGESVTITGEATINSLGTGFVGCKRELRFTGASTLVHSSSLQLPMGVNITTADARCFTFRCIAPGTWVMTAASHGFGALAAWSQIDPTAKQNTLPFNPVQQGTGVGQIPDNVVKIGWGGDGFTRITIDATDMGRIAMHDWVSNGFYPKAAGVSITPNNVEATNVRASANLRAGLSVNQETAVLWNSIAAGDGASEWLNTRGGGSGGHAWYSRATGADAPGDKLASLSAAGNFTAKGDVTAFSDLRLKTEVRPIEGALGLVRRLQGLRYVKDGRESIGFGAQPFGEVLPELRHIADDEMGTQSVAYGNVTAVLNEAIKELADRLDRAGL